MKDAAMASRRTPVTVRTICRACALSRTTGSHNACLRAPCVVSTLVLRRTKGLASA